MMIEETTTVRWIKGPAILLQSGEYFDLLAPEDNRFTIEDIAHGLSNICRFTGQCARFYSVAEHSIHISHLVPPKDGLAGLLHDAAEAFIGDVSKPLKELLPEYRKIEARIEVNIFSRFGVPFPLPNAVKEADIVMLATEQLQVMRNRDDWDYTRRQRADIALPCWYPCEAEQKFLARFAELTEGSQ